MDTSEHVKKVHEWVAENVQAFSTPKTLVVDEIEFDWKCFSGSFSLKLDDIEIDEKFDFSLGIDGMYHYFTPMFTSPLGAPASFAAIELSEETDVAITNSLNQIFPRMAAFGLHPVSKQFINSSTPISERILDKASIESTKELIESGKARIEINLD
jgi:hypothetical protein